MTEVPWPDIEVLRHKLLNFRIIVVGSLKAFKEGRCKKDFIINKLSQIDYSIQETLTALERVVKEAKDKGKDA